MFPWRRILIPTDFSTASEWVFEDAVRLAGSTGSEILILHVRMTRASHPDELRFPADPSLYDYVEQVELEKLRNRIRRANATIPTQLLVKTAPDPGAEISRTASSESADLIVMATHARHHVAHILVGGTTQALISEPPAPVLAIRYGIKKRPGMSKIVVPLQLGEEASPAVDLAVAIAARERGEVHLLTVCKPSDCAAAESQLAGVTAAKLGGIRSARNIVTADDVEREIKRYVDRNAADALFLSSKDRPSQLKLDIIRNASVPVMIVPA